MGNKSGFEALKPLPIPLSKCPCVLYKKEILICGGFVKGECYSYHTEKNEYKKICSYPNQIIVWSHQVLRLVNKDSPDEMTLLSFGGAFKHSMIMKYVSVWDDEDDKKKEDENAAEAEKVKSRVNCNEWVQLTDQENNPVYVGTDEPCEGMRSVIGGNKNHLLFFTYTPKNFLVINLNTFQCVKREDLPVEILINFPCLVSKNANDTSNIKNKNITELLLFCENVGLSIDYDEDNNTLHFGNVPVCTTIAYYSSYSYVHAHDTIFFFGGQHWKKRWRTNAVHKYSIKDQQWTKLKFSFPGPCGHSFAILNDDHTFVHILGGVNRKHEAMSVHFRIKFKDLMMLDDDAFAQNVQEQKPLVQEEEKEEKEEKESVEENTNVTFFLKILNNLKKKKKKIKKIINKGK
ncbi:hypothetical protein RFI_19922 [Reticulomyxa filosa]|uniref:Kelch domain-containing protein n=1 Tax=Reticulomyxa filosa TaxID=46433 RepID=X6MWF7_RETFI|nr:hypothetical protein RFI_19922 [Reticulomyxa filosa]|eukprot:ETO17400.1 hypothetical protein RFI_19922 [Reticulomyxa filosa]